MSVFIACFYYNGDYSLKLYTIKKLVNSDNFNSILLKITNLSWMQKQNDCTTDTTSFKYFYKKQRLILYGE
jgi:hypothetical protein